MSKKGFERHSRKYQAKQQASSKFSQKPTRSSWFGYLESEEKDPKAINKIIDKITK